MGYGDEIMASGMARGAQARGKRIAFGDQKQIVWSAESFDILQGNPNVARPGEENAPDLEWIAYYKGHRIYGAHQSGVWTWNQSFHAIPGEIFFSDQEREEGQRMMPVDAVVVEPHVKRMAPNKLWSLHRTVELAWRLRQVGHRVVQFDYGQPIIEGVEPVRTGSVRLGLAALSNAKMYVGPEGMLHHAAAAFGKPAVVIFGGYISPSVTGYAIHTNLVGTDKFCGRSSPCQHCRQAMDKITVDDVLGAVSNIVARSKW